MVDEKTQSGQAWYRLFLLVRDRFPHCKMRNVRISGGVVKSYRDDTVLPGAGGLRYHFRTARLVWPGRMPILSNGLAWRCLATRSSPVRLT